MWNETEAVLRFFVRDLTFMRTKMNTEWNENRQFVWNLRQGCDNPYRSWIWMTQAISQESFNLKPSTLLYVLSP